MKSTKIFDTSTSLTWSILRHWNFKCTLFETFESVKFVEFETLVKLQLLSIEWFQSPKQNCSEKMSLRYRLPKIHDICNERMQPRSNVKNIIVKNSGCTMRLFFFIKVIHHVLHYTITKFCYLLFSPFTSAST